MSHLWTKKFVTYIGINFLISMVFYLLMTTMTLYAIQAFNANHATAGLAASIFVLGALVTRLLTNKMTIKFGVKKVAIVAMIFYSLFTLIYLNLDSISGLYVIRFFHGGAFGVINTIVNALVVQVIAQERRGEGISYFSLSTTLATAIGPFIGVILLTTYGFTELIYLCTAFSLVSFLLIFFMEFPQEKHNKVAFNKSVGIEQYIYLKVVPICFITFLMAVAYSSILSFVQIYAIELNLSTAANTFFIVYAITLIISRPYIGKLFDKKGENKVVFSTITLFSGGLILLSFTQTIGIFLLAAIFIALGLGNYMSSAQAIVSKMSNSENTTVAVTTHFLALDLGNGFGPLFLGFLINFVGLKYLYLILSVVVLLLVVVYYFVHGKNNRFYTINRTTHL